MPHKKSAEKSLRKNEKRRMHNRAVIKDIKTQVKKMLALAEQKDASPDQLQKEYNVAAKKLDKAAARRVIHPNHAARNKSQLARLIKGKK